MSHTVEVVYTDDPIETLEGDCTISSNCVRVQTYATELAIGEYEIPKDKVVVIPFYNVSRVNILEREEDGTRGLIA